METKTHFTAVLTFATEEKGGRPAPLSSGYRPGIRFPFAAETLIAILTFPETELVFPGDTVTAQITLPDFNRVESSLYPGLDFELFDRESNIGTGVITKRTDPK